MKGKNLKIIRQLIKEKINKGEGGTEDEEYKQLRERINRTEKYVEKSVRITRTFSTKSEGTSKHQNEVGEFFSGAGMEEEHSTEYSEALIKVGEALKSLSTIQHSMLINIIDKFVQPTTLFQTEFEEGTRLHNRYNNKRLEANAQTATVESLKKKKETSNDPKMPEKIAAEEAKLEKLIEERDDLYAETYQGSIEQIARRDTKHLNDVCNLLYSFHHFFAEGYTLTHDLLPYIDKLKEKSKSKADATINSPQSKPNSPTSFKSSPANTPVTTSPAKKDSPRLASSAQNSPRNNPAPSDNHITVQALYDYDAQEKTEISFKEGDKIIVHNSEGDWWLGCNTKTKNAIGYFPKNFVEAGGMNVTKVPGAEKVMEALYTFQGDGQDELGFEEGDLLTVEEELEGGWLKGLNKRTGKRGLFPSNYVKSK
ncbi:endophilin-A [Acrasis kona]|uniref:Endophilin-A n=1 Tax=Acrasis kona TaxID=1008807 RepID=A0AAW2ZCK1_9EUKA